MFDNTSLPILNRHMSFDTSCLMVTWSVLPRFVMFLADQHDGSGARAGLPQTKNMKKHTNRRQIYKHVCSPMESRWELIGIITSMYQATEHVNRKSAQLHWIYLSTQGGAGSSPCHVTLLVGKCPRKVTC